ncbi:ABC transporter permease, partial [bacterium]
MQRYILSRLVTFIPVFFLISVIVFFLIHLIPGDPIEYLFSAEILTPELRAEHAKALGLDQPLALQYVDWMTR